MKPINKAVFPVAGLGTRFLPATKANPKEMLPIVDKPLIQYAVEEAIDAGCTEMVFITSSSKRAIEDHFDRNYELEIQLAERHKHQLLELIHNILPPGIQCVYVRQPQPLGLGHAILSAKAVVGNEPFAVLLADDLFDCPQKSCLRQMVEVYTRKRGSVIAVETVAPSEFQKYGMIGSTSEEALVHHIHTIVEKPTVAKAPSAFGVAGRYLLTPEIFSYLEQVTSGAGGEIQLTDAISMMLPEQHVYGYEFQGKRYDCGSKLGYLKATVNYALKHPELAEEFKDYLQEFAVSMS